MQNLKLFSPLYRWGSGAIIWVLAVTCVAAQAVSPRYGPGASDTVIKIGNTMPYTGPASVFGTIGRAAAAYFEKLNAQGGINGRRVEFVSLDDGYNPAKTKEQFRKLVERDQVLLVFAPLGTPTNIAIQRYINDKQVPHLFVVSGASRWAQPDAFPWTIGWGPTYQTEGEVFARHILSEVEQPRIAVLYPNNDIGKDYLNGIRAALGTDAERLIIANESFEVTDASVNTQVITLAASGANVLINLGLPKSAAQAIKQTRVLDWRPLHIVSSLGSSIAGVLRPAGVEKSIGLISAKYHKDPNNPRWDNDSKMNAWRQWMRDYYPDGDLSSNFNVTGYSVAQTLEHLLRAAGDDLSRENLMRQATQLRDVELDLLLPGITLNTSERDYQPMEALQLVRFDGAVWQPLGGVIDVSR